MKKHNWKAYLPLLEFSLSIPFVEFRTLLLTEEVAYMQRFTICRLRWRVWKWNGEFNLYRHPTTCVHIIYESEESKNPKRTKWTSR